MVEKVTMSTAEVLDRWTIERLRLLKAPAEQHEAIRYRIAKYERGVDTCDPELMRLAGQLAGINSQLWEAEEAFSRLPNRGPKEPQRSLIGYQLAQDVRELNNRRCDIKRQISIYCGEHQETETKIYYGEKQAG